MHNPWFIVGLAVWGAICNVWGYLLILQIRARRKGWLLPEVEPSSSTCVAETVHVVVPVRNVGSDVAGCLRSILAQTGVNWRLTVVDDRSEDDTAGQVRQVIAECPHARLVSIRSLPSGWLGKSHALWTAAADTREDWLLFVDDDCLLEPVAASRAIAYACDQQADLLTLWPRHLAGGFWEHVIIPLCGGIIALWFGSPDVNRDRGAVAFGNGQFLLVRRDAYHRMGGHAGVRDAIIEDVPLAENAKQAGLRCRVASGASLFGVRMYRDYGAIVNGWTRIFVGALRSGPKLALSMLWLFFGNLWPFIAVPVCMLNIGANPGTWPATTMLATTHLVLLMVVSYRFWGYGRCDRRYLWVYPLSVILVLRILGGAWWQLMVRRRVAWRDTSYRIDRRARIIPTG